MAAFHRSPMAAALFGLLGAEAARTVLEGDFEGYAELDHPDAVLVLLGRGSVTIASALDGWKRQFVDTNGGKAAAEVEFRLIDRLNDATTLMSMEYQKDPATEQEWEAAG